MRMTIVTLMLLSGVILSSAENAHAQGCPSGQYAHGRCMQGAAKPQARPANTTARCPNRVMGRCA
jgi:hypothetical protein